MAGTLNLLAVDLGADSGRLMLGRFDGDRLSLEQLHRFDSHPVRLPGGLFTDVAQIWRQIQIGLRAAAGACGDRIDGIGVDTWGVDFALLDREDGLLGLPCHYRSDLFEGILETTVTRVPRAAIFAATGVQLLPFNTLYQLLALADKRPSLLAAADRLLFVPDLFTHWLGGDARVDRTIASTSQCYDPAARNWAFALLDRLALPRRLFGGIREPGSVAGVLDRDLAAEAGLGAAPVLSPAGHDTALAVAAIPARGGDFAYVSSGTWSLVGTELRSPIIGEAALAAGCTNEVGVCDTIRFLKNVCGLWLVQESRRTWAEAGAQYSHADLVALAGQAPAWGAIVDVNAPEFARPGDMPWRIADYCSRTGQPVPQTPGGVVRVVLDSLALKYRQVLAALERLTGRRLEPLHIVGGGSLNRLLCQLAADATARIVVAGPVEATAAGNVLMQALALGQLGSLADLREVVRRSFDVQVFEPRRSAALDDAYDRFRHLVGATEAADGAA